MHRSLLALVLAAPLLLASPHLGAQPNDKPPGAPSQCARGARISIEGTPKTPTISFDDAVGVLTIKGRSIPENSIEFYKPLVDSLERYARRPAGETFVNVHLSSLDKASFGALLDVFRRLESIHKGGSAVTINWHYEQDDEDMQEAGEDYQAIINVPFKMVSVAE